MSIDKNDWYTANRIRKFIQEMEQTSDPSYKKSIQNWKETLETFKRKMITK